MSNTWTMLACCRDSDSRASSRNMATNFLFLVRFGRIRLIAMFFLNPCIDSAMPRNTSAMPPAATRSVIRYRLSGVIAGSAANYNRRPGPSILAQPRRARLSVEISVFDPAGALDLALGHVAHVGQRAAAAAGLLGRLLALALLLAVDAQRRHRTGQ